MLQCGQLSEEIYMKEKKNQNKNITNLNINENMFKRNIIYELKRIEINEIIGLFTVTGTLTLVIGCLLTAIRPVNGVMDANQIVVGTGCGINSLICYTEALINLKLRNKLDKEEKERIKKEDTYSYAKEYVKKERKKEKIKYEILKRLEEDKPKQKTLEYKEDKKDNN